MTRIWKISLVGLASSLVSLKACALSNGSIDGHVLDETTGQPVSNAIVTVYWTAAWTKIFGESSTSCYHVETARTDVTGKYHIPAWSRPWTARDLRMSDKRTYFDAYKAGYLRPIKLNAETPEMILIRPFTGTKNERFDDLTRLAGGESCRGAGESAKNLYRLDIRLADELKAAAQTPEQKERAEYFASSVDYLLVDHAKPTMKDHRGQTINVNPSDNYDKQELLK